MNVGSGEQPSSESRFARVGGLPWRAIGDRVIVAAGADEYRELGGLAMPVWVLLDRPRTVQELAEELVEVLPDAPDDVSERVRDAIDGLMDRGLVRQDPVDPDASAVAWAGAVMGAEGSDASAGASTGAAARPQGGAGFDGDADDEIGHEGEHEESGSAASSGDERRGIRFRRSASVDPDSTPSEALERVLRSLVAFDLSASERLFDGGLSDEAAMGLVARAAAGRLTGPLLWAVLTDRIALPPEAVDELTDRHRGALLWCLRLEQELLDLVDLLEHRGIHPVVLKGPAVAHLDRPDPSLRTFADIDLLVRPDDLDATVHLLGERGGTRPWPQRRPGFDRRFAKSVTITLPDGVEIDLHRNLCDGVHGFRVPVDELHATSEVLDLAGQPVRVLNREHRMLHAAYHAVLGSSRPALHNLADLAVHLRDPSSSREQVVATAQRWRGSAVLAAAIDTTEAATDLDGPVWDGWRSWRDAVVIDEREWAIVAGQREDGSSFGRTRLAAIGELSSRTDQLAYARALLWPTREHLRARGRRRSDLVRSIGRRLFRSG